MANAISTKYSHSMDKSRLFNYKALSSSESMEIFRRFSTNGNDKTFLSTSFMETYVHAVNREHSYSDIKKIHDETKYENITYYLLLFD